MSYATVMLTVVRISDTNGPSKLRVTRGNNLLLPSPPYRQWRRHYHIPSAAVVATFIHIPSTSKIITAWKLISIVIFALRVFTVHQKHAQTMCLCMVGISKKSGLPTTAFDVYTPFIASAALCKHCTSIVFDLILRFLPIPAVLPRSHNPWPR